MRCGGIKDSKMIVFDSSAWIEYLNDTKNADLVDEFLEKEEIITPSIVLIELSCKAEKEGWDFPEQLKFIKSRSRIIGLTARMISECGKIYNNQRKNKPKFGIADSIVLTTAINFNARILTKDNDFRDLNEAIMLK